ncbi:NAD(P)H-dependent oxidoreductase subunit E [Nitriliruptor alkaliphilus]|uniref:NAD(P)H-dependent oxidoreductase subunit E n=1 Tax=Nitriliruptor alkaliphilus TaxID=427918 RepID=UPI0006968B03|nr:NAD(P)H-dependent oxidoreductase subunit E [Nitriliruptor alkaliphilus]
MPLTETTRDELRALTQKYPVARAALLPMLHLVQAHEGYVSEDGVAMCADVLGLTKAEVGAVATFYTMYKREPVGDYLLSVCTNPTCKIAGGQAIYESYVEACGGAHVDPDGAGVMVEHAECLGICDAAPVVQINYEMFGPVTQDEAMDLLKKAKAGDPPASNRSGQVPPTFTAVERELSGIDDGVHAQLVDAARVQATSPVPPAYRSGETDIPVTHPGGDPTGHGGQAFAAAAGFGEVPSPTDRAPDAVATDAAAATEQQDVAGPEDRAAPEDVAAAEATRDEGAYSEAQELGEQVTDPTPTPPGDASVGAEETMDEEAGKPQPLARTGIPADAPEPGTPQPPPTDEPEEGDR